MSEYVLECRDIMKSFSGVTVLDHARLAIKKGKIHALMGENGAGKSTLIKIITGVYSLDDGEIFYNGESVKIRSRSDARNLGISTVFQELSLVPTLTVAENILLGREPSGRLGLLDKRERSRQVQAVIDRYSFSIRADDIVENLSIAQRQVVEILKGLALDSSLLILDEPTASLTNLESKHLFEIVHSLADQGVSILYISHRLEEVYRHADSITVLRDGRFVDCFRKTDVTPQQIVKSMIGKELGTSVFADRVDNAGKKPLLEVENLTVPGRIENISFTLYPGEVLGLSGLVGSGRTEVLRAIFGADTSARGTVRLDGKPFRLGSISSAVRRGIGYVPEDRASEGYVPMSSERSNLISANLDWINRARLFVNRQQERDVSNRMIQLLNVRPADPNAHVINLSGGNQQKIVLGKWLARDLKVLLVDEPTAGVDVGAKDEIYAHIETLTAQGAAVLLVSSDLTELLRLSNRIMVLRRGRIIRRLLAGEADEERLLTIASGLEGEDPA